MGRWRERRSGGYAGAPPEALGLYPTAFFLFALMLAAWCAGEVVVRGVRRLI